MKFNISFCLALVLAAGLAVADEPKLPAALKYFAISSKADQPEPATSLKVIATPSKKNFRLREPFNLGLRVENHTATNQSICVMICSWQDEWRVSNTKIPWGGADCEKNFPIGVTIPPDGAYTNEQQMFIYDLIPDKQLSFRMGFTSIGSTNTFWSNEVKLTILPPDTWRGGAAFYRDRNHDGKIDWEVSGGTWQGHLVYPPRAFTNADGSRGVTQDAVGQGVDVYKVDTNFDGFYDLEYGAGGTNGRIQWSTNIHERVPAIGKNFVPVQKESWMDWWKE